MAAQSKPWILCGFYSGNTLSSLFVSDLRTAAAANRTSITNLHPKKKAFFVACTVSFRSLWISREQKARDQRYELYKKHNATPPDHQTIGSHTKHQQQQTASRRRRNKWDHFYDSVLETLNGLEAGGGGGGAGGVGTMVVERGGVVMDDSSSSAYVQLAGSGSGRGTPQYPSPEPPQKAVLAEYCSRLGSCKRNGAIMPQPMRTRHDGESLEIESI